MKIGGLIMKWKVNVKKLDERAKIPTYGSLFAAGCDLYALLDKDTVIEPGKTLLVRTGIAMEIPKGSAGFIYARSGIATKRGLAPANKVAVIDSDYRGEIMIPLHNHSKEEQVIENGERIAQLVIEAVYKAEFNEVEELDSTLRDAGGFGSTGNK